MEQKFLEKIDRIDIPISGMSCASCAARIEKCLTDIKGVKKVVVNLASENATLLYNSEQTSLSNFIDKIR